jgi:hypothetical protein
MKPIFKQICLLAASSAALLIAACGGGGGGGDSAAAPPPPAVGAAPTSLTVGPITGFGSVIVNGVRFDDSGAQIEFEDNDDRIGDKNGGLQIGMVVALKGQHSDDNNGRASNIYTEAELRGPVQSVAADSLVVMGQTVRTTATTSFLGVANLAALKAGDTVQVHGLFNSAAEVTAFLIVRKDNSGGTYKTTGKVSAHDTVARTFKIGQLLLRYDTGTEQRKLPAGAWNDLVLRVRGPATGFTASPLELKAARIKQSSDFGDDNSSNSSSGEIEVRGFVSDLAADKSSLKINGMEVKLSASTQILPAGRTLNDLANGKLVEAEGSMVSGVLTARKIKFEDENELEVELKGAISNFVQNTDGTLAFTVRNQDVVTNAGTSIDLRGRASALANGVIVEVKGRQIVNGKLVAQRVKVDD